MKILVISHPRSGTGYAAKCLQDIGFDVGHERLGENGISSWSWAVDCFDNARWGDNYRDISPDMTILLARNPYDVIASMAHTAARAFEWMEQWIELPKAQPVEKAAASLVAWTRLCINNRNPHHIVRTVDFQDFCEATFGKRPADEIEGYNARHHENLTALERKKIDPLVKEYRDLTSFSWKR